MKVPQEAEIKLSLVSVIEIVSSYLSVSTTHLGVFVFITGITSSFLPNCVLVQVSVHSHVPYVLGYLTQTSPVFN